MKRSILTFLLTLGCLLTGAESRADVNVLIIGSTRDSGEMHTTNVSWNAQKPAYTNNSELFSPTEIGTHLQSILAQDGRGSVNVTVLDRYRTDAIAEMPGWRAYSYNLATWFHYPYPAGSESNRWANLRGEAGTNWDYVVLIGDPYTMEYTPGMYAQGVAKIAEEVSKSTNAVKPETVLLMPWPALGSSSSTNHYKEVVYRTARSGGFKVAPAGLAWATIKGSARTNPNPDNDGAYIAAASIYSCIYTQSASASGYVYNDSHANTTFTTYTNNNNASQYTGTFSFQNPYLTLDDKRRGIRMSERGTSTEEGFKGKIKTAMDRCKVTYAEYNDGTYVSNIPPAWATSPLPIDFNYGRDGFFSEDFKSYIANPTYWNAAFGYYYQNSTASYTVETANDIFIGLMQEQDNDLANRMLNEAPTARNMPTRSLWAQIHKEYPTLNPMRDSAHLSYDWDEAVGTYIYTLFSGRCPLDPKLATDADNIVWTCRKIGYETAWRVGRCQARAPGFKVTPSAAAKKSITPGEKETMSVQFILPPTQAVTVDVSTSNTNAAIVGPQKLYFTPQNYDVAQNVIVAGLPGSATGETFNVVFTTASSDEVYNGLNDTWDYQITRSAPVTLTRVNKGTNQVTAYANLPVTINLNTAGSGLTSTTLAGPNKGVIAWSGTNVNYTPNSDYMGKDGFSFAVTNAGTLSVGYIEITVTNVVPNGMVSYRGNGAEGGGAVPVDTNSYAQSANVTVLGNTGSMTRVGYNFNGWNTATNGTGTSYNAGATFVMGSSGVILYAKWISVPTYTVTFNGNANSSGSVPWAQTKTDGVNLTLATNIGTLTRNGYTFVGWNTLANGTGTDYAAGGTYSGNASITLYAKWTPNNYTVTFNANGGGTPSPTSKVVTYDSTYGTLAAVSYPGYTSNGWFTATNGGTRILEATTVTITGNQTLYAQWTAGTSYTVTYDANGATSGTVPADQSKMEDIALNLAANSGGLALTNYTFAGWNTVANGSGTPYAAGASYATNAAVTLYAQWALNTYTVAYNGNGSTGGTAPSSQTKTHGIDLTLSGMGALTRTGYTFVNWNTAANGSGASYTAGAVYSPDAAVTLYAQWTALPTYTVTFNGNGNTGGSAPPDQTKIQGSNLTLSGAGTLVRTGYAFANWNTAVNGSGTAYAAGANYSTDAAITLYAQWTLLPTYTVTYNGNGSTGGAAPSNQTKIQGSNLTLSGTGTLVRTGYAFANWNTAVNGSGTAYAAGAIYSTDAAVTLYAQWAINTYAVTYNGNGSTGGTAPADQTKTYGINLTLAGAGTLVKTGYVLAGWNTAADGTVTDYATNATYSANDPLTLYAKWDRVPTIQMLNPGNGATGASSSGNLVITFSENVTFGTGTITLRQFDGTLIESFNVASPPAGLTISGATVTLNPTSDLAIGTTYYIEIDATAIDDLAGNSFAGISGNSTWSFTVLPLILADSYLTSLDVTSPATVMPSANFPSVLDGPLTGSSTLTSAGNFGTGATVGQLSLINNTDNSFNGNIAVNGGTLRIAGNPFATSGGTTTNGFIAPSMTSSNTITINRAGTLTLDDNLGSAYYAANRFGTSGNRPAVNLAGGTINLSGLNNASSSVQTFGALTSSAGQGTVNVTRNASGNPALTFGSLTINRGSILTFNGTSLGTGTNDARITFTSAPTLTNGILAGARFYNGAAGTGELVTYGTNGVTTFTAYDVSSTNINGATSVQNFQLSGATAPVALVADTTVNSLNYAGLGGWTLGGFKLTIGSGLLLRNGNNSDPNIQTGMLTAGNGTDPVDLNIIVAQNNMTIGAVIADNGASAVTLVKSGDGRTLNLNGGTNNTYSGGTYVVGGTLSLGNVANRTYLGTGKATVDGASELTLGNVGATSNSSGDDYTAINGGKINIASGANGTYTSVDTFNVAANSIIAGGSASGQGLASLTRNSNVTLASGAIIGHSTVLSAALNLTTGTIQSLGTAADLYYGLNGNQNNSGGQITIGSGTAFRGISTDRSGRNWEQGTINIASGTTSVDFQGHASHGAAATLTLGNGATAGNPVITLAGTGAVDINAIGSVTINDSTAVYGDTGAGQNVRFVATAGSTLTLSATNGMGSGTGIASALVQNGGSLAIGNTNALNGAVTVEAGGRLVANQAGGLTGTGALTFNEGSILEISNATGFSGTQATAASVAAGTIVRVSVAAGTASDTLDSFLGSKSPIYLLNGDIDVPEPSLAGTTTMTLNKNGSGVGGIVINGSASAFFRNNVNGQVTLGANGGVMAATTGTELQVQENIVGTNVTLTIGTTAIIDGIPKRGTVALGSAAGSNSGFSGEVIINAGILRTGYADVLGATNNQLTVNTGGTLLMNSLNQTVGNLTGTGGTINLGSGTLTIGQGNNGGGNYQGSIQGASGKLTKVGTGTNTLSGTNTYTGVTTVNDGTLLISGNQSAASGVLTVNTNATLGGTGVIGGNVVVANNGRLAFDISTASASHDKLELAAGKTLTFSGASVLTITSSGGAAPGIYTLITGGTNITGVAPATLNLPVNWIAATSISSNSLLLNVTSVGVTNVYDQWLAGFYGTNSVDDTQLSSNGVNTIREAYVIGLNPTSPTGRFEVAGCEAPSGSMELNWSSVSGRVYNVYWSSNLLGGADSFLLLHSNLPWNVNSFTDTVHSAFGQGFYRIGVQLE